MRGLTGGAWRVRAAVLVAAAALGLVLAAGVACGPGPAGDAGRVVVADVNSDAVRLADLQAYLDTNLLESDEGAPGELDHVKSRMLDELIDEVLLAAEARQRGLAPSERALAAALRLQLGSAGGVPAGVPRALRDRERRRLSIVALQEAMVAELPPLPAEAVRREAERAARGEREETVMMRALMLDGAETAADVHRQIRRGLLTFDEALAAHATHPGQGVPAEVRLDSLEPVVREALDGQRAGGVTPPVESQGAVWLFQRLAGPSASVREQRLSGARHALEQRREREAVEVLLDRLRSHARVAIRFDSLPFSYRPERPPAPGATRAGRGGSAESLLE